MRMAGSSEDPARKTAVDPTLARLVDRDTIQVEFLIDDLVKQLLKDPISPVANCNGCSRCSAITDLPNVLGGRK
jgi:hypothetical protein